MYVLYYLVFLCFFSEINLDGWIYGWINGWMDELACRFTFVFTISTCFYSALDGDLMCDVTIVRYVANAVLLTCHFRLSVCMYVCLNFCN